MKPKNAIIFLIAVTMFLSTGCGLLPKEDERLSPPIKEARTIAYKTEEIKFGTINKEINLYAQWKAENKVYYSFSEFNAPFYEYFVIEGDEVKPGDILASLDIGDIDKQIRDIEISYQSVKLSYDRTKERYEAGVASEYDLRIAELNFEDITNKYNDLLQRKNDSLLIADVTGTVMVRIDYVKGDMVNTGVTVMIIVENDNIILQGSSSLMRSSSIKVGDEVILKSQGNEMTGTVVNMDGSYLTAEPEYMMDDWKLGSTVVITIPLASAENVLIVHRNAVKSVGGRDYVRVLIDGVAIEKNVVLGISSGSYIEVKGGLEEGDLVILN